MNLMVCPTTTTLINKSWKDCVKIFSFCGLWLFSNYFNRRIIVVKCNAFGFQSMNFLFRTFLFSKSANISIRYHRFIHCVKFIKCRIINQNHLKIKIKITKITPITLKRTNQWYVSCQQYADSVFAKAFPERLTEHCVSLENAKGTDKIRVWSTCCLFGFQML